jgi:hypothetical protein
MNEQVCSYTRNLPHSKGQANCPYLEPNQSNPYPIPLLEIDFNIVLGSTPRSSKWSLSLRSLRQSLYTLFLSSIRTACPVHPILFYIPNYGYESEMTVTAENR